ncbi:MAG: diguanylate cyclase [Oscillospiraceae bacterium]|nr:diguanylate cyclase [Oscillospiraceae bacterium]
MRSIRARITLTTVCAIILAMTVAAVFGVVAIRDMSNRDSNQMLYLLCETGQKNLDSYFRSVEQSLEMVSAYIESDLDGIDDAHLAAHTKRVDDIFAKITYQTNGVLTYYYRIDPEVSKTVKGFWFVNLDGNGFVEHEVTDITLYDKEDTSSLVWFTVPRCTGRSIWLPPYITENLDVRVLSYNIPIYYRDIFVGVIGIEIDYRTMAEQVDHITLYTNGYAFINDAEGTIIYHPRIDLETLETNHPKVPEGLLSESRYIRYNYEGVEKQAVWLPLINGMRLNVSVPVSELNVSLERWILEIVLIFSALVAVIGLFILRFTGRIIKPLQKLTEAAEQVNNDNYDVTLDYDGPDEVGILTRAFNRLINHLKHYISDLNDRAYADALTGVRNKGAYNIFTQELETQRCKPGGCEFAVCTFDCNNLKLINDRCGHDKGDLYLKRVCAVICETFDHSPVFRIGGDEFVAVLQNTDFQNREELIRRYDERCAATRKPEAPVWEQLDVARGLAVYDPKSDHEVEDVVRRADKLMYENKRKQKKERKPSWLN